MANRTYVVGKVLRYAEPLMTQKLEWTPRTGAMGRDHGRYQPSCQSLASRKYQLCQSFIQDLAESQRTLPLIRIFSDNFNVSRSYQ